MASTLNQSTEYLPLAKYDAQSESWEAPRTANQGGSSSQSKHLRRPQSSYNLYIILSTLIIPIIVILVWAVFGSRHPHTWGAFTSAPIGGQFTQPQAKAVDLLCSVLLAPITVAIFNYFWFTTARVAAINELDLKPTSLTTMTIASSSAAGSYDILRLWALIVKSRALRLVLLGLLVLNAAIAGSALANMIAYEAYTRDEFTATPKLQYLWSEKVDADRTVADLASQLYGFDKTQQAAVAREFTGMLTGLSFADARPLLNGTDYYMVNVTATSLNALPNSIVELPRVPAVKYGIECETKQPEPYVGFTPLGARKVVGTFPVNLTGSSTTMLMTAQYSGKLDVMKDPYNNAFPFVSFTQIGDPDLYFAFGASFDQSQSAVSTKFGTMHAIVQNMTRYGFNGTKSTMSWWGMQCRLKQTPGTIDLRRSVNSSWYQASVDWKDSSTTVTSHWQLQNLQLAFDYSAPGGVIPGLAPAIAVKAANGSALNVNYWDYETSALNLLYAECETRRILYETALKPNSSLYTYETVAAQTTQHYRITYVPLILFAAVIAIFNSAAISLVLTIWVRRTASGQQSRSVDVLRFVVDAIAGLKDDESFLQMRHKSNAEIDNWSEDYLVQYKLAANDGNSDGLPRVVLTKAAKVD